MAQTTPGLIETSSINGPLPIFAPPYNRGNYHFSDCDVLVIKYRTTRASIEHLIPSVLHLEENPLVTTSLISYGMSSCGPYKEFVHQVEVQYNGQTYDYSILLVLDNEDAVYAGREVWGYPKVLGVVDFDLSKSRSYILGSVQRPATNTIASFTFKPCTHISTGPLPPRKNPSLNIRVLPSAIAGQKPSVRQFIPGRFEFTTGELWQGVGSIQYPSNSEVDPMHRFLVVEYESAFLIRGAACSLPVVTEVFDF